MHFARRLKNILACAQTGLWLNDKLKLSIIGYARGHTFGPHGVISRAGQRLFPEIAVRPQLLGGQTIYLDPSDLSQLVVFDEVFVQRVYDLDLVPFRPDLIMDCGAHVGAFTLLAGARFPESELIAFEPDPANFLWLKKQADVNQLGIQLVQAAVSISDGEAQFLAGRGCGGSLVELPSVSTEAVVVRTVDLAAYLSKHPCASLLIKLDIEGAERMVLPRIVSVLPTECCLFFETHDGERGWIDVSALLKKHGFTVQVTRRRDVYVDGFAIRRSNTR